MKQHRRNRGKSFMAGVMAVCLAVGMLPSTVLTAFAAQDENDPYAYELEQTALVTAVEEAVEEGSLAKDMPSFSGDNAKEYETLFEQDGSLYEVSLDALNLEKSKERDSVLDLRVFVRVDEDAVTDGSYDADGSEDVLFLLENKSADTVTAKIYLDENESQRVTVCSAEEILPTETAEDSVLDADSSDEEVEAIEAEPKNGEAVEAEESEEEELDAAEAAEIDEESEDAVDESGEDAIDEDSEDAVDESGDDAQVVEEAAPDEEPEEVVVEEAAIEEEDAVVSEEPAAELAKEAPIDEENLLDGTVHDPVCADDNGAAAFEMTLPVDAEYEIMTLAEGDVYNVSYIANMDVVEFPEDNPTTVADGETLDFSVIVPDGYLFDSVTANGTVLSARASEDIDGGAKYQQWYAYSGADSDVTVEVNVHKEQVIDGYGRFTVKDQQTEEDYTVTVNDVPTNTAISLSYGDISITDKDGEPVGVSLSNRLYYAPEGYESVEDWIQVAYVVLDGSKTFVEEGYTYYVVVPYNEFGEELYLDSGSLWLRNITIVSARADIMPIQTDTLCALDESGNYTQEMVGAIEMSTNPQVFYYPGYEEDYVELSRLTNGKDYKFYYGTLGEKDKYGYKDISKLNECEYAQIVKSETTNAAGETIYEYSLNPVDDEGKLVEDYGNLYMEYDKVYSFDVEYESMVNEHTEDNGDVYLWMGTQYYVDKYHNQGTTTSNYTNTVPASNMSSAGVWVQLGNLREDKINNSGTAFSTYASVTKDQLEAEGVTSEIANAVSANYNYGIAGPYTVTEGATDVETYTTRVTGHIGDEFTASQVFDSEVVYMATDSSEFHETDWVDLGAHASDTGTRAWWYWINDYYLLNNYEDELEFLEIAEREDETTGETQVRLEADEMGASGLGEEYDVWNIDLITKRESVVETDLMTNQEKYEEDGVGFSSIAGLPHHVQLRMNGTFETYDEQTGETYFGELTVLADEDPDTGELGPKAPYVEYSIPAIYSDGSSAGTVTGSSYINMENEQEAQSLAFTDENGTNVYVPLEDMFDDSKVVINVTINFEGTITSSSGETITYDYDNPYTYTGTLTAAQLKEAYDTCPNNAGYDFAVNLSTAYQKEINTDTEIILYKVWDDNTNGYDSRGNVSDIIVTLERSEDGTNWETVYDKDDPTKVAEFTIQPPLLSEDSDERDLNANQWSLVLTSDDLDLTYGEGDDQGYYQFRIATEEFGEGQSTSSDFTYNTMITGTSVTNTLVDDYLEISGEKLWEDADGEPLEDIPVDDVIITLYQDDHYFGRRTVGAASNWTFDFTNLPRWNGTEEYVYTLGEMTEDGTPVEDGQSLLIGNEWFHIEIRENEDENGEPDGTYSFVNVKNPDQEKDVDADGDGEYGDNGMGVKVGDTVTYQIEYTNYYPQEAQVIITDVVDEGLDFVEASDGGVYDEETRTITWTFESVEAKTAGSVTFSAIVNDTALVRNEIDNTAEVQVGDDPAVETNTVYNPVPDKDVDADGDEVYEDSGMQVEVGDTLVYKIDYENPDDEAATVTITDELDVGLDFVSATDNGSYDGSKRMITWTIEDVEPHTNGSVYFTATVNENALVKNYVENTASVQVGEHDAQQTKTVYNPVPGKDVDANGDGVYGDNGEGLKVGDTVTYEISYFNGYDKDSTVTITDTLDDGLTYVSSEPLVEVSTNAEGQTVLTWTIENVEAQTGGSVTFEAVVNRDALVINEVENTATVEIGNSVETNTVYNPVPDKNVDANGDGVYDDSGMMVEVGGTVVYKIDYENPDDEAATVTITDEVDVGLDFVSATNEGSYNASTRTITWVIEGVEAHTNGSVYFTATVNETALVKNVVENTATVQVGNHAEQQTKTVYNPLEANEKAVDTDGDDDYNDNGESVKVGDTVTYRIDYENYYPQEATVIITDVVDEGLDFVEASDGGVYDEATRTITWTFKNVEAGYTGSVTFSAIVNETALVRNEIDNTAEVQVGDDPAVETNTVYNPVPDKDVDADGDEVYEDSGMQVQIGDTLVYKIDYENPDDEAATVTITDVLDEGLDFVEASDGGTYDESSRTITWTIEDVEPHTNGSVYFTATVNENAQDKHYVDNTAYVQVGNHEGQQTKTVYNPIPDKDVDADGDGEYGDNGESVHVGDTVTYEITYINGYEDPATVTITDVLDDGLTYVSSDPEAEVSTNIKGQTVLTWTFENVEALAEGSVTFTAIVNENALEMNVVDNTAEVQVNDDPAVETETMHNPVPDKDVDADGDEVYEDSGMQVQIGDTLVYKIDYENPDDEAATVTITDEVDVGLDFVEATDDGTYNESARMITWVIEGVEAHTNGSVYFTATVNENALVKNYVENTATVQVGEHEAQQTKTVYNPVPDKKVDVNGDEEYEDNGESVQVGDTLTYEITYYNGYETPATVTITDELDEGLDFVEASDGGTYNERTHTITWVIEDVKGLTGGSVTFTATVNETALVKNEVDNTAKVQIGDDPKNIVDTPSTENPVPDKDVDADGDEVYEDSGMQVEVGGTLVYKIDYENPDDTEATVTITDEVDVGLDFVSATDEGSYDASTRMITWVIEGVEAHTNGSVYFTATVNENALVKNYVENTATVQVGEHDAQQTKTVYNPVPGKDVDANGDGEYGDNGESVQVGDTLTYEITYFNGYEDPATVTITDELDDGLTYVSSDPEAEVSTNREGKTVLTWTIEDVKAQTGGSVTFDAVVNENALEINEVENTATVQVGDNPDNVVNTNTEYNPVPDKDVDADGDGEFGDSGMQVQVGDTLVYKIEYQNPDDEPATVTITDVLDPGLDFEYADNNGTYDESTRTITWVLENVAPHSEEGNFVLFVATVNEEALVKNEVDNTATVQVGEHDAQQTKTVYNPVPGKGVDANGDGEYDDNGESVKVGDTLSYEITYDNEYDDPATVTITDVLDEGLDFVSATEGGTYDEETRTITWVIADVAAHSSGSVTFTATVNENALVINEVENTATVQVGDNPDNVAETNPVYNPVPDKDVDANGDEVFEDSGMQVQVGDTLVYKIDYQNSDDEAATVTITDVLDEGLDFVSASDGGTYDKDTRTITWVLPDIAPHSEEGYYVTFTAIVNENAKVKNYVDNTAVVQVGEHDAQQTKTVYNPVPSKDVDADENHIFGDNGEEVYVGETMTYTINFFNGYDVEEEVIITDTLDDGLSYVEGSASEGGTYDADTHTITWDIEHVDAHTGGAVTFSAVVNGSSLAKNEVDNTATVQIGTYSIIQTNTVENPVPDKDVDADGDGTYGDNGLPVKVGDDLTYRVDYHNSDDIPAEVIITDVLDVGLDFVSASDGGTYDESTRTITWTIEDVEAHTTGFVTFEATVNENALEKNEVENTASVKVGDWPAVDTNTVYNPVTQKDVDIHGDGSFGDSGLKVSVGDTLTYKVDYENPDDTAATVTIKDVLDEGLDFVTASDGGTYDASTRTITWVLEDVSAHAQGSVTFDATANEKALVNGEVDNTATIQVGDHPEQQTNTVWNPLWEPEKSVDTDGNGDFEDDGVLVSVGDELVYKVTYKNYHDEAADITITDTLDADVTFVSATDGGLYDAGTHTITWTFSDVEAGYEGDVQFTVTVKEDATGKHYVDNTATVKVGNDSQDTNTVHNPVTEKSVDVNGDGDFSDNGEKVEVGDELTYRIDYTNGHDEAATVTITDALDPNVAFVSATDEGSYDKDTHTVTWTINNVAAGTEDYVEFTVKVLDSALAENEVDNTASVKVGNDTAVDTNKIVNPLWEPEKSVDTNGDGIFEDDGVLVHVGDELVYQVTYKNYKEEAATITITDALDPNVAFVSATDGGVYDTAKHTITWTLDNVAAGDEGTVQFTVTALASALAEGEVDNTASVKVGNDAAMDTNKVENPLWEPEKSVDTNGDGIFEDDGEQVQVGDELVYQVTYKNYHDEEATITITDALDPNVEFVSATDDGVYESATHTVTWTLDNVAAGDEGTVQFTVTALQGAEEAGEVVNTASVKVGNDEAQDTNTLRNPVTETTPEPTPTPTPTPDSNPNPTSSNPNSGTGSGSNPSSGTSSTGTPKTGDVGYMYLWIMLIIAAAAVTAVGVFWRTRRTGARK